MKTMKVGKIGSIFLVAVITSAFFATFLNLVPTVHAASPTDTFLYSSGGSISVTGNPFTTASLGNPHTSWIASTTIVISIDCGYVYTNAAPKTTSLTDNMGNTYTPAFANYPPSFFYAAGSNPTTVWGTMEVFYLQTLSVPAATTYTLTDTWSGSQPVSCLWSVGYLNALFTPNSFNTLTQSFSGASAPALQIYTGFTNTATVPAGGIITYYNGPTEVASTGSVYVTPSTFSDSLGTAGTGDGGAAGVNCVGSGTSCTAPGATVVAVIKVQYISYTSQTSLYFSASTAAAASTFFNPTFNGLIIIWQPGTQTTTTTGGGTQTQTIGSCPTKNTGTFTMVNNTIYMYYGNALGSEVVNTVQTSVASITGSGSHTLKMLLYVSSGQGVSVATPLVLAYQQSIVISSGTTNNVITFQVNIPLNTAVANPLPFNLWGVGIVGDNKIKINQSSLSGLFTQTGSASTANQPASFTSQGTSVGTMLYLCATASYQSVLPAVTTTTTQSATTTSTAFTTSTATISTIGATLFTTSSNWPVIFLILLLPAGLFLGVTKTIAGAILGLVVGSVIGELMGILPTFVFVGLVISLIAVAFVARNREGG